MHLLLCNTETMDRRKIAAQDDEALQRDQTLELVVGVELLLQLRGRLGALQRHGQVLVHQCVDRQRGQPRPARFRVVQCVAEAVFDGVDRCAMGREEVTLADQEAERTRVEAWLVSFLKPKREDDDDGTTARQQVEFRHSRWLKELRHVQRAKRELIVEERYRRRVRRSDIDPPNGRLRELPGELADRLPTRRPGPDSEPVRLEGARFVLTRQPPCPTCLSPLHQPEPR